MQNWKKQPWSRKAGPGYREENVNQAITKEIRIIAKILLMITRNLSLTNPSTDIQWTDFLFTTNKTRMKTPAFPIQGRSKAMQNRYLPVMPQSECRYTRSAENV
jgi:hypothetical protein